MVKPIKDKGVKDEKYKAREAKSKKLHDVADKLQKQWGMPGAQGLVISQAKPAEMVDGNLHTWLSAKKQGEELVHDAHFIFVNPPVGEDAKQTLKNLINMVILNQMGHKL